MKLLRLRFGAIVPFICLVGCGTNFSPNTTSIVGQWKCSPETTQKLIELGGYNPNVKRAVIAFQADGKFSATQYPDCLRTPSTPFKNPNKQLHDFSGVWRVEADSILLTYDYTETDGKIYQTSIPLKCDSDLSRLSVELGEGEERFVIERTPVNAAE